MIQRSLTTLLVGLFFWLILPDVSNAQALRPDETFYLKPRVGIAWHLGDTEQSPFNFNMDAWEEETPYAGGLELGYQFNQNSSLSLGWSIKNHPLLFVYGDEVPPPSAVDFGAIVNSVELLWRYGGTGRVAPFVALGANATFGQDGRQDDPGFGPSAGLGFDVVLNDRISLVLEWIADMTFGDKALDGLDAPVIGNQTFEDKDFAPFDVTNAITLGLKFNFKSAFTPVSVLSVDCPTTLEVGETGAFTMTTNADATQPVTYSWSYGDGASGTGMTARHSFSRAGTFTVTGTANNGRASDSRSCTVTVNEPPVAASIVTMSASPQRFELCAPTTVNFSANVRGDTPITYAWDFGDGSNGTGANPTHTYTEPGTYTVRLTTTNATGSDTKTLTVTAERCQSGICFEITEMNSVYFNRNASTLSPEARAALQENLDILAECPNLCARVEGFSAPGERNPQNLSEDRARAVEQFYIDNGIAASRLTALGMGRVGGTTSKKEGTSLFRRADTIPMQCVDMNN